MLENNLQQNSLVVNKTDTLKQAMQAITANQNGAAVVVDETGKLVGVLSDGDVRRALLQECSLITPVEKVMNINPVFCQEGTDQDPTEIFRKNDNITILPVVDKEHRLIKVLTV